MSSFIFLRQPRNAAAYLITDGASYTTSGLLASVNTKVAVLPRIAAAVYTRGPANVALLAGYEIDTAFASFDDLVLRAEDFARGFHERHQEHCAATDQPEIEMVIAGWSIERRRPEGFLIRMVPEEENAFDRDPALRGHFAGAPFELQALDNISGAPGITPDDIRETGFRHADVELMDAKIDGLHLFLIQRGKRGGRPGQVPYHAVGGFALLTTIRENEITQSVLDRFPEDKIGEMISPKPIDWIKWNAEHRQPASIQTGNRKQRLAARAKARGR